jgi:hypothetical protein
MHCEGNYFELRCGKLRNQEELGNEEDIKQITLAAPGAGNIIGSPEPVDGRNE